VPDLRGRVSVGAGQGANLAYRSVGSYGGEETHTLSVYEMPVHNHLITDPGHSHAVYDPGHSHGLYDPGHQHNTETLNFTYTPQPPIMQVPLYDPVPNQWWVRDMRAVSSLNATRIGIYSSASQVAIYASGAALGIQNAGSGGAHNNMQPFAVVNKIIHI
jgi:microcystin-dependent protein